MISVNHEGSAGAGAALSFLAALGSRGAALLEPYSDDPGNHGLVTTPPERVREVAVRALQNGFQLNVHAIGDRANRFVWLEGTPFKLKLPAASAELEAAQFGGKGFAHLNDPNSRCIPVDQIYITSDLNEQTGPSIAGQHVVHGDRAAPADMISQKGTGYREVDNFASPAPASQPTLHKIVLHAYDDRRNLIPNSSFELGGGDYSLPCQRLVDFVHNRP